MHRKQESEEFEKALNFFKDKINGQKIDKDGCVHIVLDITEACWLKHFTNIKVKHIFGIKNNRIEFYHQKCNVKIHADTFKKYLNHHEDKNLSERNIVPSRISVTSQTLSQDTQQTNSNSVDRATNTNTATTQHSYSSNIPIVDSRPIPFAPILQVNLAINPSYTYQSYFPQVQQIPVSYTQSFHPVPHNTYADYYGYQTQSDNSIAPLVFPEYQAPMIQNYGCNQPYEVQPTPNLNQYTQNLYVPYQQVTTSHNSNFGYQTQSHNNFSVVTLPYVEALPRYQSEVCTGVVANSNCVSANLIGIQEQIQTSNTVGENNTSYFATLTQQSESSNKIPNTLESPGQNVTYDISAVDESETLIKEKTVRKRKNCRENQSNTELNDTGITKILTENGVKKFNKFAYTKRSSWVNPDTKYAKKLVDANTGIETTLEGKALDSARDKGDVITQGALNTRKYKNKKMSAKKTSETTNMTVLEPISFNMENIEVIQFLKSTIEERTRKGNFKQKNGDLYILYISKERGLWLRDQLDTDLKMKLGISDDIRCKGNDDYRVKISVSTFNKYIQNQNEIIQTSAITTESTVEPNLEPSVVEAAISGLNLDKNEILPYEPEFNPFANEPELSSFEGSLIYNFHDGIGSQNYDSLQNDELRENLEIDREQPKW